MRVLRKTLSWRRDHIVYLCQEQRDECKERLEIFSEALEILNRIEVYVIAN